MFLSYLHDKNWINQNIEIYTKAIEAINSNKFKKIKNLLIKQNNNLNKCSTCGFLKPQQGLLNLKLNW